MLTYNKKKIKNKKIKKMRCGLQANQFLSTPLKPEAKNSNNVSALSRS